MGAALQTVATIVRDAPTAENLIAKGLYKEIVYLSLLQNESRNAELGIRKLGKPLK